MKKIKTFIKNIMTVTVPFYMMKITAHAGSYDFLDNTGIKDENIDRLGSALKREGAGLYSVWQVLGIIGVMCALVLAGAAVAMSHNAKDRQENKSWLLHVCAGGIGVFGIVAVLGGLAALGKGIGGGLGV
ncbi:hypothetical protein C804_04956 [Lachnospiraceae bacterium A4]|jgi:hypothetical protein|nr:hypothetical protein C804_04956 [Lachnospiraceae bacterium A4]